MGDMADYYMEQELLQYFNYENEMSERLRNKVKRYDVTDDEIREFLFKVSTEQLCHFVDLVVMEFDVSEVSESEIEKVYDIAAKGITHKSLSNKQSWYLGAFVLYHFKFKSKEKQKEDEE